MTSSSRSTFSLTGPSIALDPRVHAVRGDLADIALAGQLFAPHYAQAIATHCIVPSVMLNDAPGADGKAVSQLLFGEEFMLVDVSGGWAWGYCRHDHYVGYLPEKALTTATVPADGGVVTVRTASIFSSPDDGAAMIGALPMGAVVNGHRSGDYIQTELGFVHLDALNGRFADAPAVAETLIDTPYVWGGRSSDGIDCSGLIQLSLALTGTAAPRDSDQQQNALGSDIPENEALRRGDLVFFPGHVGIMAEGDTLIHATMHHGKTVMEPLADVIARFSTEHPSPIAARKRLS